MKNYVDTIVLEEGTDIQKAVDCLKENGFDIAVETCYMTALKTEILETLEANGMDTDEKQLEKVLARVEKEDGIWESVEDIVKDTIERM